LKAAGVFNNGTASLKLIFDVLQKAFHVKATHYYSYFQSMRIRKKNRTPGLDMIRELLIRDMDDSDENPRYK
jgi:hypothetical protein